MEQINYELSKLGFDTTKYTCSITLSIFIKNDFKSLNFYILDKANIYDCLNKSFLEG